MGDRRIRVAFCHPDLGLGGAERLVVDAACELAKSDAFGHVDVWTAFYDPSRAFEETLGSGGFSVRVAGGWFPRSVRGRAMALCAYVRCCLVALAIIWSCWFGRGYDVVIVDQVSVVVFLFRALSSIKVLFYCHFPDQLLSQPQSRLHRLYRAPLNWLEETTTGMAHMVVVNSKFTRGVFATTFTRLAGRGLEPGVLYPAVRIPDLAELEEAEASETDSLGGAEWADFLRGGPMFLSINRFERKKGLGLALRALAELRAKVDSLGEAGPKLVLAGGYDPRLDENVQHLEELKTEAEGLGISRHVKFLPSFSDRQRSILLARCRAVLYTPINEHFGIVPLEAMAAARPVVACNSGGPCESIGAGERCGFLCDPTPSAFAEAMRALLDGQRASTMGAKARENVVAAFSREAFGRKLEDIVMDLAASAGNIQMHPFPAQ